MVLASTPVASVILLAALPVGAARAIFKPNSSAILSIAFSVVVLPVPGPPVIINNLELNAALIASDCLSAKHH